MIVVMLFVACLCSVLAVVLRPRRLSRRVVLLGISGTVREGTVRP